MKTKPRPPMPPWLRDPHPDRWVRVSIAARFYFRKHPMTIKRAIKTGYLEENGIPSYWDGYQWFVRLPYSLIAQPARRKQNVG